MKTLKYILRLIAGFAGGLAIGAAGIAIIIVCFTDMSLPEFYENLKTTDLKGVLLSSALGIVFLFLSVFILIPIHELGHLIAGLLSGYKFVSFRIGNLTFVKIDGKLKIKHFSVAGTGGQCLLDPPDRPLEQIPTDWYNIGGVVANIIAALLVLPVLLLSSNPFVIEAAVIFLIVDAYLIIINGIPMKISGAANDGYNLLSLKRDLAAKNALVLALKGNVLIQNGVRPKDMPDNLFITPDATDYRNPLELSIPLMSASRLVDEFRFGEALREYESIYLHKKEIIPLYVKEIESELVFLRLVNGDIPGASELFDGSLKKYIETYSKVMSSKQRILFSVALFLDKDPDKANKILEDLESRKDQYLLQGEVRSDLAVMRQVNIR